MKWVTRRGVRMDRVACAWLIKRHLDPRAELIYAEASEMAEVVEAGALPFHNTVAETPDTRERTSFQELLAEYKLDESNDALALMGEIVRGAETKEPGSVEEGEGLRAIAKGMNALCSSDDEMVERMLLVFDALYAYCQRRVAGNRDWANSEASWWEKGANGTQATTANSGAKAAR